MISTVHVVGILSYKRLGREVRREIGAISGEWLDTDSNLDRWEGTTEALGAWERRVLLAQWSAEAWRRVSTKTQMLRRMFERTGCHLAREPGALDKLVALEQLTAEQREECVKDLAKPYDPEDARVCSCKILLAPSLPIRPLD